MMVYVNSCVGRRCMRMARDRIDMLTEKHGSPNIVHRSPTSLFAKLSTGCTRRRDVCNRIGAWPKSPADRGVPRSATWIETSRASRGGRPYGRNLIFRPQK